MKALRAWIVRLGGLFRKARTERELTDEIECHLAICVADHVRSGMTEEEARRQAILEVGGLEALREAYRERSTTPFLEHLGLDVRFAFRQLRKSPGFAFTAVLILALAMCASLAIFTFVEAALIRPLPYPEPKRLVVVTETSPQFPRSNLSYPDYQDWKRFNRVFKSLDVSGGGGFLLKTATGVEPIQAARVSAGFFRTLGIRPLLGRDFQAADEAAGGAHTLLLTYPAWKQRFAGSKSILGQALNLSGEMYTVVGVLPADFQFAPRGPAEFWTIIDQKNACALRRSCHSLDGIARLKDGVSIAQAQADMDGISKRLERQFPESNREQGASVVSAAEASAEGLRLILQVLMAGAMLLLAIACVNVASLVLVRSEGRRREMALRRALGATLTRLITQFVSEGFVLVAGASGLGLLLAHWTIQGLTKLIPADMLAYLPLLANLGLNAPVVACAAVLSLLAVTVFSIAPVLHLRASKMRDGLAEGSRGSAGKGWRRLGSRLVVVELSLAMILLVGAGLCAKSFYQLMHVDLGFHVDHLATIDVAAPDNESVTPDQSRMRGRDVVRSVARLPGVRSVALTTVLPVSFNGNTDWIRFVGKPYDGKHIEVNERDVSSEYFRTIGATLLRGRYFTDAEDQAKPNVVIINETLARKYFAGENPIGRQIGDSSLTPKSIKTIIGVVKDIRDGTLDSDIWPAEYHPFNQDPSNYFSLLVQTRQRPEGLLAALRPTIQKVHPEVGTKDESTVEAVISNSMTAYLHRAATLLVAGFALMAFFLGVIGLYGVVAYSVSQRTREIGVRMALGAERGAVYQLVLREAGLLVALGIGAGTVGALLAAASARQLLFGVRSWDVETLLGVAVLLSTAALTASFIPARRATKVSPMEALRTE